MRRPPATPTASWPPGPGVRYAVEPRPGLGWARNRALAEASGEILAFTDDDVVVDPGWVEALAAVFQEDAQVGAVNGADRPAGAGDAGPRLFEEYRKLRRGQERIRAAMPPGTGPVAARYGLTGSFAPAPTWRSAGGCWTSSGASTPASARARRVAAARISRCISACSKAGHALVYEPAAVVGHRHRRQMYALYDQIRDHGISFSSYVVRSAIAYPDERWPLARLWALVARQARLSRAEPQARAGGRDAPAGIGGAHRAHCAARPVPGRAGRALGLAGGPGTQ